MPKILGLSGSLRKGSFNAGLLRAARDLAPEGTEIEIGSILDVPLYNADLETAHGLPAPVQQLQAQLLAADGLLLVTPEYNNGIPGVFKNAIDWLSRPAADIARVFGDKPFALVGASPGGFGTILSQNHWLPVLKTLGVRLWAGQKLMVSRAGSVFDAEGNLVDDKVRAQLAGFVEGFAAFATNK